jgi:hypothetical protein
VSSFVDGLSPLYIDFHLSHHYTKPLIPESLFPDVLLAISPLRKEEGSLTANGILGNIMLEKNGRKLDFFPGEVSTDRITAIQVLFNCHLIILMQQSSSIVSVIVNLISFHLIINRKLTGVWHLRSLKLMELTIQILKRSETALMFLYDEAINMILVSMCSYSHVFSCLEQLELLVTTLIDLDAMDGKGSVSLLAECSNSPDVNTR